MSEQPLLIFALIAGLVIVAALAFYAGKLLFQLKLQVRKQDAVRRERIDNMIESIRTISMAVQQQQCNLSEGAIRLVNLLESLPVKDVPDCKKDYPFLFELFELVKDLPTHDARKTLPKSERIAQDKIREEHEARLETGILKETLKLKEFTA